MVFKRKKGEAVGRAGEVYRHATRVGGFLVFKYSTSQIDFVQLLSFAQFIKIIETPKSFVSKRAALLLSHMAEE